MLPQYPGINPVTGIDHGHANRTISRARLSVSRLPTRCPPKHPRPHQAPPPHLLPTPAHWRTHRASLARRRAPLRNVARVAREPHVILGLDGGLAADERLHHARLSVVGGVDEGGPPALPPSREPVRAAPRPEGIGRLRRRRRTSFTPTLPPRTRVTTPAALVCVHGAWVFHLVLITDT